MKKFLTPLSVGIFTSAALGVLMWGVLRVKKGLPPGAEAIRLSARFPDASGLGPRTRVVMSGVNIGQIESIDLDKGLARITMSVRGDAGLKKDASIAKRQASVLGDYFLELYAGVSPERMQSGDEILNIKTAVGMDVLLEKLAGVAGTVDLVAKDIRRVSERVASIFGSQEGAGKMREILDSTAQIARRINGAIADMTGKLNRILDNFGKFSGRLTNFAGDTSEQVKKILGQVAAVATQVRGIVDRSGDSLKGNFGQVKDALEGAKRAVDSVNRSLSNIEQVTGRVREGEGVVGALTSKKSDSLVHKTEKILDTGEKTVGKVGDVVDDVGDSLRGVGDLLDPLTRLQPIVDLRTEVSALSAKIKTYVSLQLQTTLDKFYFIELVNDPRGRTTFTRAVTRSTSSRRDPVEIEETTLTEDKLKFTFQLAKKFHFTTWRFGVKESTGGLGLDFNLPGRFDVNLDLFDFIGDARPRLKAWGVWQFYKPFYVAGGIDDAFNPATRDYFVGLGLRFTDEDLKSLLLIAPRPN